MDKNSTLFRKMSSNRSWNMFGQFCDSVILAVVWRYTYPYNQRMLQKWIFEEKVICRPQRTLPMPTAYNSHMCPDRITGSWENLTRNCDKSKHNYKAFGDLVFKDLLLLFSLCTVFDYPSIRVYGKYRWPLSTIIVMNDIGLRYRNEKGRIRRFCRRSDKTF